MLISISEVETYVKKQGFVVVDKWVYVKGIVNFNVKGSVNIDILTIRLVTFNVIGVNVWLWPRMFLMNLVNLTSRALTIMVCFLHWYVFFV